MKGQDWIKYGKLKKTKQTKHKPGGWIFWNGNTDLLTERYILLFLLYNVKYFILPHKVEVKIFFKYIKCNILTLIGYISGGFVSMLFKYTQHIKI